MKLLQKKRKCLSIIDKIEKIRAKNNSNWMDIFGLTVDCALNKEINLMKK
jgi:hypothetical protein